MSKKVAEIVVDALQKGREDLAIGAVAEEIAERLAANPKEIEREIKL